MFGEGCLPPFEGVFLVEELSDRPAFARQCGLLPFEFQDEIGVLLLRDPLRVTQKSRGLLSGSRGFGLRNGDDLRRRLESLGLLLQLLLSSGDGVGSSPDLPLPLRDRLSLAAGFPIGLGSPFGAHLEIRPGVGKSLLSLLQVRGGNRDRPLALDEVLALRLQGGCALGDVRKLRPETFLRLLEVRGVGFQCGLLRT